MNDRPPLAAEYPVLYLTTTPLPMSAYVLSRFWFSYNKVTGTSPGRQRQKFLGSSSQRCGDANAVSAGTCWARLAALVDKEDRLHVLPLPFKTLLVSKVCLQSQSQKVTASAQAGCNRIKSKSKDKT